VVGAIAFGSQGMVSIREGEGERREEGGEGAAPPRMDGGMNQEEIRQGFLKSCPLEHNPSSSDLSPTDPVSYSLSAGGRGR